MVLRYTHHYLLRKTMPFDTQGAKGTMEDVKVVAEVTPSTTLPTT